MKIIQNEFISFRTTRNQKLRLIDYCKQHDKKVSDLMREYCEQLFGNVTLSQSGEHSSTSAIKGSQA